MTKFFLLICFLACTYKQSIGQTATLHPVKDNTIFNENAANSNGAGADYFVGKTGQGAVQRGLLQFDVTSIPAGSVITSVTLAITCTKAPQPASRTPNNVKLHKCLAAWGEGTSSANGGSGAAASAGDATWTCSFANGTGGCTQAWVVSGGDFSATVSSNVTVNDIGVYTFVNSPDLTADVQKWVDTPQSNFGWILIGDETSSFSARLFGSKESNLAATTLTITYSPASCTSATWTGAINSSWETPGNWTCGKVPDNNTDVIINSGTVIVNSNAVIKSLTINPEVNFTVISGFKLTVTQ
ncbi:MAG: DNRLRE domain-containing protein [Ginsengibacter sp.]